MKKNISIMFEDLFVSIAFAESGVSETELMHSPVHDDYDPLFAPAA